MMEMCRTGGFRGKNRACFPVLLNIHFSVRSDYYRCHFLLPSLLLSMGGMLYSPSNPDMSPVLVVNAFST